MKFKKLKEQIETVLKDSPPTRNDDVALTIGIWKKFYSDKIRQSTKDENVYGVYLHDIFFLPREDTIKRIRAVIQNEEGRYVPTNWAVAKKRQMNEQEWRKALGYNNK